MVTYLLRDVEEELWNKLKEIKQGKRLTLRVLILRAIEEFIAKHGSQTGNPL